MSVCSQQVPYACLNPHRCPGSSRFWLVHSSFALSQFVLSEDDVMAVGGVGYDSAGEFTVCGTGVTPQSCPAVASLLEAACLCNNAVLGDAAGGGARASRQVYFFCPCVDWKDWNPMMHLFAGQSPVRALLAVRKPKLYGNRGIEGILPAAFCCVFLVVRSRRTDKCFIPWVEPDATM